MSFHPQTLRISIIASLPDKRLSEDLQVIALIFFWMSNLFKKFLQQFKDVHPRVPTHYIEFYSILRHSPKIIFYIFSICQVRIKKGNMGSPIKIRRKSIL